MRLIKVFDSTKEAEEYACNNLCKQETEIAYINNKKVLLVGTPMVEDIIVEEFAKTYIKVTKTLTGEDINAEDVYDDGDLCNAFVDLFLTGMRENTGLEIVYGTTEY